MPLVEQVLELKSVRHFFVASALPASKKEGGRLHARCLYLHT
jgi:hypothetical protein